MSKRRFRIALVGILVLALGIRVWVAFDVNDIAPQSDAADFDRHATSIANGDGYPESQDVVGGPGASAFRPPLYPFALATAYDVSGTGDESERWLSGRLEQALLGAAIVALIALVARMLMGRREALIAAGIAAVYPPLIVAGTSLLSEPLFISLMLAGLAAVLRYRQSAQVGWLALAGVCGGLASLTRGNGLVVILILALGVWVLRPRGSLRALAAPAMLVAAAALTIAPWTIRNAIELDAFVPVTTQGGVAVGGQYNDLAKANDWRWVLPSAVPEFESAYADTEGEVELSRELTDRGLEYAVDHPGAVPAVALRNTLRVLSLREPIDLERSSAKVLGQPEGLAEASVYAFWALALIALAGAFTPRARRLPAFVWALLPLWVASIVLVGGNARYRSPLEPFVILLAAAAAGWAVDWFYRSRAHAGGDDHHAGVQRAPDGARGD